MTLITFQSRIHFASHVLEDALHAELEESRAQRVLILADEAKAEDQIIHRVRMGVPNCVASSALWIGAASTDADALADDMRTSDAEARIDAVIGCGSSRAIAAARRGRQTLAAARLERLPKAERRTARLRTQMPDFFAVPGVDGLPDPCMSGGTATVDRTPPPNVIICDPSLLIGASETDVVSAFVITLGRCLATISGSNFNPLADGMAVDGLRRLAKILHVSSGKMVQDTDDRELMAASLNAAISQQKGPGLLQALTFELTLLTQGEIDAASLHRILLPRLLRDMSIMPEKDQTVIARILDAGGQEDLPGIVETILNPLPLNSRLREMGLARGDIKRAISDARTRFHVPSATADRLTAIVEDVY